MLNSYSDNDWTVIYVENGKVIEFSTGDDRAGGKWNLKEDDTLENIETVRWLFECIHKLPWRSYLLFKKDVGQEFITWVEKQVESSIKTR
jgi:hypothetical protein